MDKIGEMMQSAVNCDYETLARHAKEAVDNLTATLDAIDPEATEYVLFALASAAIFADGTVSELERKLLEEVFHPDEGIVEHIDLLADSADEGIKAMMEFAQVVDADTRANIIMLCLTFVAVDKKINKEESAFIRKLYE